MESKILTHGKEHVSVVYDISLDGTFVTALGGCFGQANEDDTNDAIGFMLHNTDG